MMKYPLRVTDYRAVEKMLKLIGLTEVYNCDARVTIDDMGYVVLIGFYAETVDDENKRVAWVRRGTEWLECDGDDYSDYL